MIVFDYHRHWLTSVCKVLVPVCGVGCAHRGCGGVQHICGAARVESEWSWMGCDFSACVGVFFPSRRSSSPETDFVIWIG